MVILTSKQVERAQARRLRFALYVLTLTGQPYLVPHPYLRSARLCWSTASTTRKTLVANH